MGVSKAFTYWYISFRICISIIITTDRPPFWVFSSFWYVCYSSCQLCPKRGTSPCMCRYPGTKCIYPIWSWFSLLPQVHCLAFCRTSVHSGHMWCSGSCLMPFWNSKFCLFITDNFQLWQNLSFSHSELQSWLLSRLYHDFLCFNMMYTCNKSLLLSYF